MDGHWRYSSRGGYKTSRVVAVAVIAGLHLTAFALALNMRGPRPDAVAASDPIVVSLSTERPSVAAPEIKVQLQQLPAPVAVVPEVQISLPVESTAITVAVAPPAPAVPPTDAGDTDGPVAVSKPDYLRMPSPVYPAAAKRARAQGVVHVRAVVDVEGLPRDVRVERTSGFSALDKAACDAVMGAQFKPYRRNNIARAMVVIVPVEFSLSVRTADVRGRRGGNSELDVRGEHHHAMGRHAKELGGLSTASLHPGE
jgi:protein TonB